MDRGRVGKRVSLTCEKMLWGEGAKKAGTFSPNGEKKNRLAGESAL